MNLNEWVAYKWPFPWILNLWYFFLYFDYTFIPDDCFVLLIKHSANDSHMFAVMFYIANVRTRYIVFLLLPHSQTLSKVFKYTVAADIREYAIRKRKFMFTF